MSEPLIIKENPRDPVMNADEGARAEARGLLETGHAALAWTDPDNGTPGISRITFAIDPVEGPLCLISELAPHTRALRTNGACAMMVGDVGPKGDPMTHARLMVRAQAEFLPADHPGRAELRARWLERNPKATVYIDLPDFHFVRIIPQTALLNGGFARAFRLTSDDLIAMMKV
ncbi:pyridoxamine 5'-phosphate oxidase family protein [Xinfangfangia sp. CPCC 101601]|uniref:Pyridoxamine 5'-phosphate oxidase family protein n=1 Tax=Pseudogemmobacter lacusdianii TaxID=3069608 RepID=A0ABU0W2L7_9RHOB|nr:pyridoxamine 5'-phosphate oxidase family protein [Xinfangfangia sp. CPCC 101601]MDQ2067320.1 pyridoxamine 5'-phosphate oxidase family protein [Xinfangfangia sp. CPCC 101601]